MLTLASRTTDTRRRVAAYACQRCRSRKVRCDVDKGGIPCTNCRLDCVGCELAKRSKRRRAEPARDDSQSNLSISRMGVFQVQNQLKAVAPGCSSLPSFIRPLLVASDELLYLQHRGAFDLPPTKIRNQLLSCYVEFVHPFLPVLDLQSFLAAIEGDGCQISLLVFQAVMFAGTGFIEMDHLQALGYTSRRAARSSYLQKCRILHDIGSDCDRLDVASAALLMTLWYDNPDGLRDIWHWSGIAISVALSLGLNVETMIGKVDPRTERRRRRIWWCCYMRDRLISLGMQRPFRIPESQSCLSPLNLDDFEDDILVRSGLVPGCALVENPSATSALVGICISFSQLCTMIRPILDLQYTLRSTETGATTKTTAVLGPKMWPQDQTSIIRLDKSLRKWYRVYHEDTNVFDLQGAIPAVAVHRATAIGLHWTLVKTLHHPQCLATRAHGMADQAFSYERMILAADVITQLNNDLDAHGLIGYLPSTGVTILLSALVVHMMELQPGALPVVREHSLLGVRMCMRSLQRMRHMYTSATFAYSVVDRAKRSSMRPESLLPDGTVSPLSSAHESSLSSSLSSLSSSFSSPSPDYVRTWKEAAPRPTTSDTLPLSPLSSPAAIIIPAGVPEEEDTVAAAEAHPSANVAPSLCDEAGDDSSEAEQELQGALTNSSSVAYSSLRQRTSASHIRLGMACPCDELESILWGGQGEELFAVEFGDWVDLAG